MIKSKNKDTKAWVMQPIIIYKDEKYEVAKVTPQWGDFGHLSNF